MKNAEVAEKSQGELNAEVKAEGPEVKTVDKAHDLVADQGIAGNESA